MTAPQTLMAGATLTLVGRSVSVGAEVKRQQDANVAKGILRRVPAGEVSE